MWPTCPHLTRDARQFERYRAFCSVGRAIDKLERCARLFLSSSLPFQQEIIVSTVFGNIISARAESSSHLYGELAHQKTEASLLL